MSSEETCGATGVISLGTDVLQSVFGGDSVSQARLVILCNLEKGHSMGDREGYVEHYTEITESAGIIWSQSAAQEARMDLLKEDSL